MTILIKPNIGDEMSHQGKSSENRKSEVSKTEFYPSYIKYKNMKENTERNKNKMKKMGEVAARRDRNKMLQVYFIFVAIPLILMVVTYFWRSAIVGAFSHLMKLG